MTTSLSMGLCYIASVMLSFASINYTPPSSIPVLEPPTNTTTNADISSPVAESVSASEVVDISVLEQSNSFWESIVSSDILFPLIGQIGLGGVLGFATGYALKKALKMVLIIVGVLFIVIQAGVFLEILTVNWMRVQEMVNPFLEADSLERSWRGFLTILTANLPFAGGFIPLLILGLRKG